MDKLKIISALIALITFFVCGTTIAIYKQYSKTRIVEAEARIIEAKQNCWESKFRIPYVYHRHNSCTGEWSEEISPAYKKLWDKQQLKINSKNKQALQ